MAEKWKESEKEQDDDYLKICPHCKQQSLIWTKRELWECYECNRTYTSDRYERILFIEKSNREQRERDAKKNYDECGRVGLCPLCGNSDIYIFTSQSWKCNNCFHVFCTPSFGTGKHR